MFNQFYVVLLVKSEFDVRIWVLSISSWPFVLAKDLFAAFAEVFRHK